MSEDAALEALNSVEYLYLQQLTEPRDNSLRIVVQEAVDNRSGQIGSDLPDLPELSEVLKDSWPIESIEGCKTFDLYWMHYAAYLVTEEMVGSFVGTMTKCLAESCCVCIVGLTFSTTLRGTLADTLSRSDTTSWSVSTIS